MICSALALGALLLSSIPVTAELASNCWPKFRGDIRNTGLSPGPGPGGDDLAWTYTTGGAIASSPAVAPGGTAYFTSRDGYLYALAPDGSLVWRYGISAYSAYSSPAIDSDGTVYVGSDDYYLYALNPNGTLKWRRGIGSQISSSPAIGGGRVYVGASGGRIYAVNQDGTVAWYYQTGGAVTSTAAVGADGTIYITSKDTYLYALSPTGTLKWRYRTNNRSESSPAVGEDGTIYFGSDDGKMYAVTSAGALSWSYAVGSMVRSSPAIGADGAVYFGADDGYLYALQPGGSLRWRCQTGGIVRSSPAVGSDGTVYVGSQDRYIYALNPDGTLKWRRLTGGWVDSSPAIMAGGRLYVGSYDSKLYAFESDQTPPTTPIVVDDGLYSTSPDSLHGSWSASDPESGIAEYAYAIGTAPGSADIAGWTSAGTATEVTRTGLPLVNGSICYFSVKARSGSGRWSDVGVSNGILVDFTAPTTPVVVDDGAYTTSLAALHASWSASDPETGVAEYQYCIGTAPGLDDIAPWTGVGTAIEVTASGLNLANGGTYFCSVRARSTAGLWSAVGATDGVLADATPPGAPSVTDEGDFTSSSDSLHASWTASDTESGIAGYEYAIGTTPGASDTLGWTTAGSSTEATATGLTLSDGATYYFAVRAKNNAGLWSAAGASDGILVDLSAPSSPVVTDDGDATASPDTLHASWSASDLQSGVVEYLYAIGTSPGSSDVAGWTSAGTEAEITRSGLSLASGTTYYLAVKAKNGAGLWSEVGSSDGILVDLTPPITPIVVDDGEFTASADTLHASWHSSDAETGVAEYQYRIGTAPGLDDVAPWTSAGLSTEIARGGLSLTSGTTYYFGVRSRNSVGLWSQVGTSDGILADLTPPSIPAVTDDGTYTSSMSELRASWTAADAETPIVEYQYAIGTTAGGLEIAGWTPVGTATEATFTNLPLANGGTYYISIRARNAVGLWSGPGTTDGITVDITGPSTPVVEDDGDFTYSFDTLNATWASADPESGIAEYLYAIGTAPGATDTADWTSAGASGGISRSGLDLADGVLYYFSVKARNGAGMWSATAFSDGIACLPSPVWPKFRRDAVNSGLSDFNGSRYGALLWEFPTSGWVESSPAIGGDGTIYIGSGDGHMYAIRANGTMNWDYQTGGPIDSSPAIGGRGEIYFGSYDGYLYCLASNGSLRWRYRTGDMVWSSPLIGPDGTIYIGSHDGYLHAVNPNGTRKWRFNAGGAVWSSPAMSSDGVLYFGGGDTNIYAVYAAAGTLKWKYVTETAVDSSPCIAPDGTIYAGSGDSYFYALRPDGTLKWRCYTGWPADSSAAVAPDGTVYVGAGHSWTEGALYAFNPNGSVKWSYAVPGSVRSSPTLGADGTIYFGCGDGFVYALTPAGTLKWRHDTGAPVLCSAAIGRDGTLCIGSYSGSVYAFRDTGIDDTTPPTTPLVTDEGAYTLSATGLSASWTASDPESGIVEYQYAIGTAPGAFNTVPWTSTGGTASVTRNGLSLTRGTTYYVSVKARNSAMMWSPAGSSDGIVPVNASDVSSIGRAENLPDTALACLDDVVVTGSFSDCFYVEQPDRSAGIKVAANGKPIPAEGTLVSLVGTMTTVGGEAAVSLGTVHRKGTASVPRALGMVLKTVCPERPDLRPGGTSAPGLETIGLLVTIRGRVTAVMSDSFYVDDCSGYADPLGISGIKVRTTSLSPLRVITPPANGKWVRVTGVLSVEPINGSFRHVLRPHAQTAIGLL
ncbi:MAG: PQQ-binding-like beta-propeller repeat protein [Armatimonadetes bacterium]|nr:PQQ-binding-like beta-propeller repeat protein [Armatimonadota bacterium]